MGGRARREGCRRGRGRGCGGGGGGNCLCGGVRWMVKEEGLGGKGWGLGGGTD